MAKGDKFYFENFIECTTLAKKAANYLVECLKNFDADKIEAMLRDMHIFEHSADKKKHEMNEKLAKAFVTPVEREDLDVLSHEIDNVLDTLEEVLQKLYIYGVKTVEPHAIEYANNIVRACDSLHAIMTEFENFKKSKKIHSLIVECNDIEEECDKLYLTSMRDITKKSSDIITTIAWYKIYDCFEACADACEHVGECVGSIIMKNT